MSRKEKPKCGVRNTKLVDIVLRNDDTIRAYDVATGGEIRHLKTIDLTAGSLPIAKFYWTDPMRGGIALIGNNIKLFNVPIRWIYGAFKFDGTCK